MQMVLMFILLLALLVSLHEWGHFIVAKKSGVFVREFSIGMGWKLIEWSKNGTRYTLRVLPLGGYVQMASRGEYYPMIEKGRRVYIEENADGIVQNLYEGDENQQLRPVVIKEWVVFGETLLVQDLHTEETETLTLAEHAGGHDDAGNSQIIVSEDGWIESHPVWQRILIYAAGPVMNVVLAFGLFASVGLATGSPTTDPIVGTVSPEHPIQESVIEEGDRILSIAGEEVDEFVDISSIVEDRAGDVVDVKVSRDGETVEDAVQIGEQDGSGVLGVRVQVEHGLGQSVKYAVSNTWLVIDTIMESIGQLFTNFDIDMLGGPVYMMESTGTVGESATSMSSAIASYGIWGAVVSINLALVNLIPIPALDGGRILIALLEAIRRKPLSSDVEMKLNLASGLFMLFLMFAVTMNDIFFR